MNRNEILAGTRPDIGKKIIITAGNDFDGYEIMEYKGMVWGISMRAKDFGQDCMMGCKNITGGELTSYAELGDESRQKAIDRMMAMASNLGANGVIDFRFDLDTTPQGAIEVSAHGTAVLIKPVKGYVPVGAVGNILAAMVNGQGFASRGGGNVSNPSMDNFNQTEGAKYPIVQLRQDGEKYFANCPQCNALYNVTKILNDSSHDYDLEEYGQQVKCRKCDSIFTLPEV